MCTNQDCVVVHEIGHGTVVRFLYVISGGIGRASISTITDIYSDLRSADNRHSPQFMAVCVFSFYIAVRRGFDKHLYLTSCLNAHNHNTCIRFPQTGCTARKIALFVISQDRQTQVQTGDAMATIIIID